MGVLIECDNCGAPLEIGQGARIVKCRYCGQSSRVASMRTVAEQPPLGWKPPSVWTPPPRFPAPSFPLQYQRRMSATAIVAPALIVIAGTAAYGAAIWLQSRATVETASPQTGIGAPVFTALPTANADKARTWDGRSTLSCALGEKLEIDGKQAQVDGLVIDAAMSCTVRIKNSKLRGRKVVSLAMTAKVEIENSTLEADELVIDGAQASEARIEKNSHLRSADAGIRMAHASRLTLRNSAIEAKGVAVDMAQASTLDADGAQISGKAVSLRAASASQVRLHHTKLDGKRKISRRTWRFVPLTKPFAYCRTPPNLAAHALAALVFLARPARPVRVRSLDA